MEENDSISLSNNEKYHVKESLAKFEDLLVTNHLFVDYFNAFLHNPAFGEIVKFNFQTGELEVIESLESKSKGSNFRYSNPKNAVLQPNKSALFTKKNLETQLKSIIKTNPMPHAARSLTTNLNTDAKSSSFLEKSITSLNNNDLYSNRQKELLSQVENHSFKDLNLIPIKPNTADESIRRRNQVVEIKIPTIKNTYNVKVLKKPFSMKWLNSRRLSLFLESDYYNEFRLAMLLTQIDLDNESDDLEDPEKHLQLLKLEVDENDVTDLNPFNAKNDLEKLQDYYETTDSPPKSPLNDMINFKKKKLDKIEKSVKSNISEVSYKTSKSVKSDKTFKSKRTNKSTKTEVEAKPRTELIEEPNREMFKSIKDEKPKTSLIVMKREYTNTSAMGSVVKKLNSDENEFKNDSEVKFTDSTLIIDDSSVKSVQDMAKMLVDQVIEETKSVAGGLASPKNKSPQIMNIEQNYRYVIEEDQNKEVPRPESKFERDSSRLKSGRRSAINRSTSRASYYKDYKTDLYENDFFSDDDEENANDDFKFELEDEPIEDITEAQKHRQSKFDDFKTFLKDNNAFLFYQLWLDIEKLNLTTDPLERINQIKHLKFNYNRPLILSRLKVDSNLTPGNNLLLNKKNYYNKLYEQYEKNIDFWSLENLKNNLQKRLLKNLFTYWWPKFLMRMNDEYVEKKYPFYDSQKQLKSNHNTDVNDFDAKNIDITLKNVLINQKKQLNSFLSGSEPSKMHRTVHKDLPKVRNIGSASTNTPRKPLAKEVAPKGNLPPKVQINAPEKPATAKKPKYIPKSTGLEGYDLVDDFKTGPPVGWKRPASTTSIMIRKMLDNKQSLNEKKNSEQKRNIFDKDIFLEAIYHEDYGGQIFMKFLASKRKIFAINRLKCLKELMKYKELFYDDNFNQESVKKYALKIYKNHLAVSADYSIDCPKSERIRMYSLVTELDPSDNIGNNYVSTFRPVYEDTLNPVEEFLLISLYDDWKMFMEAEESYFKHNEIESIERRINIRSKKVDELLKQGLIKIEPSVSHVNFKDDSLRDITLTEFQVKKHDQGGMAQSSNIQDHHEMYNLKDVVNNSTEFEMFKLFLQSNNSFYDIQCWLDIEAFIQIDEEDMERIEEHAKMLKRKYLNKKYFFSQTGPIDHETQNIILEKIGGWSQVLHDRPPNNLILLVKKYLERKLKNYWLPLYYNSEHRARAIYQNRIQMTDVVDDVLFLKTKSAKRKQYSKIKKQRWLYSSQMVINFAKAIKNSFTSKLFNKFLSIKAFPNSMTLYDSTSFEYEMENSNLVNNLQFLIDVQNYKDKHQNNINNDLDREILFKMNHIIDCYIQNRVLPKIRIDISEELAHDILYQKDYLSPYLFLEAYLIVFNILMPYWIEFNQMRETKDIELFDELSSFKKIKNDSRFIGRPRTGSVGSPEDSHGNQDYSVKWRYNQYVKALKTQLVL